LFLVVASTAYWPSTDSIVPTVPPLVSLTVAPTVTPPAAEAVVLAAGVFAAVVPEGDVAAAPAAGAVAPGEVCGVVAVVGLVAAGADDVVAAGAASAGTVSTAAVPAIRHVISLRILYSFAYCDPKVMRASPDRPGTKRRVVPRAR
jgi:hypothetical protein